MTLRRFVSNGAVGTFSSLTTRQRSRANPNPLYCARCGVRIVRVGRKTYCGPCADIRHDETVAANHRKQKLKLAAAREAARVAHRE